MTLWFDIVFAWVSMILGFTLIVIWGLRLLNKKRKIPLLQKINATLRRYHKLIGILLIASALTHGLLSSASLFSLNWGTANFIVSILLGLSFLLRKKLNMRRLWMQIHRALTIAFIGISVVHILNVGGFILDDLIAGRIKPPAPISASAALAYENTSGNNTPTQQPTGAPTQNESVTITPSHTLQAVPTPSQTFTASPAPELSTMPSSSPVYIDGVYRGTATGFQPGLVVEVVIKNGIIASVVVVGHNEVNIQFWGVPVEVVPQWIVQAQSTDVDIVSGATYTSIGITDAVDDALHQALAPQ